MNTMRDVDGGSPVSKVSNGLVLAPANWKTTCCGTPFIHSRPFARRILWGSHPASTHASNFSGSNGLVAMYEKEFACVRRAVWAQALLKDAAKRAFFRAGDTVRFVAPPPISRPLLPSAL